MQPMFANVAFIANLYLIFVPVGIVLSSKGLRKYSKPNMLISGLFGYSTVGILSCIFAIRTWYQVLSVFTNGLTIFRKVLNN